MSGGGGEWEILLSPDVWLPRTMGSKLSGGGGLCFNCGRMERNKYAPLSSLMDYAPLRRSGTERKGLLTLFLEVVCIVHGIILRNQCSRQNQCRAKTRSHYP